MPTTSLPGRALRALPFALLAALAGSAPAVAAATLPAPAQPLGIVSDVGRPACGSPTAPLDPSDLTASTGSLGSATLGTGGVARDLLVPRRQRSLLQEAVAAGLTAELLPSVTICSPTFAGLPEPITGTTATRPTHTRVGQGWRELGGTLVEPAPLTPGDALSVPAVDDGARLTLSVAPSGDAPASTIGLADLAPGPSSVSIRREGAVLVARLVRGDGTVSEASAPVRALPPEPAVRAKGTPRRWTFTSRHAPGALALTLLESTNGVREPLRLQRAGAGGRVRARFDLKVPETRGIQRVTVVSVDRAAGTVRAEACLLQVSRGGRLRGGSCQPIALSTLDEDYEINGSSIFGYGARIRRAALLGGVQVLRALLRPQHPWAAAARHTPLRGRAASTAPSALVIRPIPVGAAHAGARLGEVRPLQADVNGDGAPDFWSDAIDARGTWTAPSGSSAGFVLVSGPTGLSPHRLDLPMVRQPVEASEVSAIEDVTGDRIGELVVDLGDRHAVLPGSPTWTGSTFAITVPGAGALDAADLLLAPSLSSPGNPYASMEDVTGDGLAELATTDDGGGWSSVASSSLLRGTATLLPSATRALPLPRPIGDSLEIVGLAPRVDPRLRVIGGRAYAVRWPQVATGRQRNGRIEVTARDARGTVLQRTALITDGNALLLDADRASGDLLLLSVARRCLPYSLYDERCRLILLRVRADGSVRQAVGVRPTRSALLPGSARFIADGPDADGESDVVVSVGSKGFANLDSVRTLGTNEADLPVKRLGADTAYASDMRLIAVVGTDGRRRVFTVFDERSPRGGFWFPRSNPVELTWG